MMRRHLTVKKKVAVRELAPKKYARLYFCHEQTIIRV